jgi:uncharacterized protein
VRAQWDPEKAKSNLRKHGVRLADAVTALEDEAVLTSRDDSDRGEQRWRTLGLDCLGRMLVVIYTWRGDDVRLISARTATSREREQYLEMP